MNITLTLDDELVKKVRKIAVDRDTTLTGLVREYLTDLTKSERSVAEKERDWARLEETFKTVSFDSSGKKWTREERNERPSKYLGTRK